MTQERAVVNISDMKAPERNVRMHPEKQIQELIRSLDKFGQCRDIVLDEDNVILAGNGLKEAMQRRGDVQASVIRLVGLTDKEKLKFMLADNKTFALGIEDHDGINALLEKLGDELDVPGYDEETLKAIVASADEVTGLMMEYGTLDQQQINSIKATGERMTAAAEQAAQSPASAQGQNDSTNPAPSQSPEATETRRSVTCPHCGEIVWL